MNFNPVVYHKFGESGYCRCGSTRRKRLIPDTEFCPFWIQWWLDGSLIGKKVEPDGKIKDLVLVKDIVNNIIEDIIGLGENENIIIVDYYRRLIKLNGLLLRLDNNRYFIFSTVKDQFHRVKRIFKETISRKIKIGLLLDMEGQSRIQLGGKMVDFTYPEDVLAKKIESKQWKMIHSSE